MDGENISRCAGSIIRYLKLSAHIDWVVNGVPGELRSAEWSRRELEFQGDNPHIEQLRPVFELAGFESGRIDYALANDRPQVFEINTDQMLDNAPAMDGGSRDRSWARRQLRAMGTLHNETRLLRNLLRWPDMRVAQ